MREDIYYWRCCKCQNEQTDVLKIHCTKCGNRRWSTLGFSPIDTVEVLNAYLPESRKLQRIPEFSKDTA